MIYALVTSDGADVKIGYTGRSDPMVRVDEISSYHPRPLRLLVLIPGDRMMERSLHKRFAAFKRPKRREWFQFSAEIDRWISVECRSIGTTAFSFYTWLMERVEDDDVIGDVARDARDARDFPKDVDALAQLLGYLRSKRACSEALAAATEAWPQWLAFLESFRREKELAVPSLQRSCLMADELRLVHGVSRSMARDEAVVDWLRVIAGRMLEIEDGVVEGANFRDLLILLDRYLYTGDFDREISEARRAELIAVFVKLQAADEAR